MRLVFLHIPKTAGQSVHAALEACFPAEAICPARVNEQLIHLDRSKLARYQVFSGHLDWSLLDCVPGPTYVFTVLREPVDRLLSFYFYLRKEGAVLPASELQQPLNRGLRAALELSPREFFIDADGELRSFLDAHFDNFYTYFFAGRFFDARRAMRPAIDTGMIDGGALVTQALSNMAHLDDVFTVASISKLFETIESLSGRPLPEAFDAMRNANEAIAPGRRLNALRELGADEYTVQLIQDSLVALDRQIWSRYSGA